MGHRINERNIGNSTLDATPKKSQKLTAVGVVVKWLGWFLFQLKNAELIFK